MALLAEPKRKNKFGLDPRNTNWSNDDSKIGQRMLEKMGWEKGKGLGAKEDGIRDHIKASYKSDTRGLGCTPKDADAWIAHQDDFNELLMQLNGQASSQQSPAEKPEERPPDGHKRYYGRFDRGRVPTLRSTEDLNCIFGKRKKASKSSKSSSQPASDPGSDSDDKKHGVTTIKSSSSVQEYFSQKMAALKAKRESTQATHCHSEIKPKEAYTENRVPAVYGAVQFMYNQESDTVESDKVEENKTVSYSPQQCVEEASQDNCDIGEKQTKKKKKKKKDKQSSSEEITKYSDHLNPCNFSDDVENLNVKVEDADSKSISRKKKKKHQVDETDDESTEGKCKRRKVDKHHGEVCVGNEANIENPATMKTKKKSKDAATNVEVVTDDDPSIEKKDKKSRKRKTLDRIEEEIKDEITEICTDESKKSQKKSKRKDIVPSESVDTGENVSDSIEENKKSKKRSKNKDIVPNESVDTVENLFDSIGENKKSKKRSKNKDIVPSESVELGGNLSNNNGGNKKSKKKNIVEVSIRIKNGSASNEVKEKLESSDTKPIDNKEISASPAGNSCLVDELNKGRKTNSSQTHPKNVKGLKQKSGMFYGSNLEEIVGYAMRERKKNF